MRAAGCVFAEDEARLLRGAASGEELELLLARRVGGEPLEYVLGWAEFAGTRVLVGPGVFVPRRRTEHLAALAAGFVRELEHPVVVDLCCGSGAIAVALLGAGRRMQLYAADVDPIAVSWARRNLRGHAHVVQGDLFDPLPETLRGRVDVLAVNTPYVPSAELDSLPVEARAFEPSLALDGGPDGLDVHRRVAASAGQWLAPGGHVLLEASRDQAPVSGGLFTRAGLEPWIDVDDSIGATVVVARRRPVSRRPRPRAVSDLAPSSTSRSPLIQRDR